MSLLPDADSFRRLVDGSARGVVPGMARLGLALLAGPYRIAVTARNAAYDHGLLATEAAPVPVVSVGNVTLGGTGKTPLVAWVARRLLESGGKPAIVSRGYGAHAGQRSDESAELGILLPGVPHVADRDRVAAARAAAIAGADVVVLDDGFQHRRLARDLDIVAVDATDPFGCGRIFPRGLLREPPAGIARADAVVLTRSGLVDAGRRAAIRAAVERACGGRMPGVWAEATHRPVGLRTAAGCTLPLSELSGRRIVGFAGIGNPAAFQRLLQSSDAELAGFRPFTDHHRYTTGDIASLREWAGSLRADLAVTTLKDMVKIPAGPETGCPIVAVEIAMELHGGGDRLEALLAAVRAVDGGRGPRR